MPQSPDLYAFHASTARQLEHEKDRIRQLIGSKHWPTDGAHKEEILREVLRAHLPDSVGVGTGFVCEVRESGTPPKLRYESSGQLDVLLTDRNLPALHESRSRELTFVTRDAVHAVIEVKSRLYRDSARQNTTISVLRKLANEVEFLRSKIAEPARIWAGLYVFDDSRLSDGYLLKRLQQVARGKFRRIINLVAMGSDRFIRFWPEGEAVGSKIRGGVWHSYYLKDLAPAYFINNIVFRISPPMSPDQEVAWFPIPGGKEAFRTGYASLRRGSIGTYSEGSGEHQQRTGFE